jgi:hypothetical protein
MRRLLVIAAIGVLAASLPLWAQHGGGHASSGGHGFGGGHGGFATHGGVAGHSGGGHTFGGMHSGLGTSGHSFRPGSSSHPSFSSNRFHHSDRGLRIRTRNFRNNCFGLGCAWGGYPYLFGGIDPYWWWDSDSSYDQDQQNQIGLANEMNQQSLDEQRMRQQQQNDQDVYARSDPPPAREAERSDPAPATVLVFHDQRKQEVQNYAIVGQTLWIFAPQRTQKVPLTDLDIPATVKVNDDRGVDFRVPGAGEGQ